MAAGIAPMQAPLEAQDTLLLARQLTAAQTESPRGREPFLFEDLPPLERGEEEAGPSNAVTTSTAVATLIPAAAASSAVGAAGDIAGDAAAAAAPPAACADDYVPKSTKWYRKRMEELRAEAESRGQPVRRKALCIMRCSHCGQRKIKETGHRQLRKASGARISYCPTAAGGKSPEEWLASQNSLQDSHR